MKKILVLSIFLSIVSSFLWADISHVIKSGDCLYNISLRYYQTPSYWRALKKYNKISNVYTIPNGKTIHIPPISVAKKIMNGDNITYPYTPSSTSSATTSTSGSSSSSSSVSTSSSTSSSSSTINSPPPYKFDKAFGSKIDIKNP